MAVDVERYYRTYGPMVMRRCRALLKDEEAAADAMQDTFIRLLRNRERLEERAPSSLLYTMATNVCLNRMRSDKRDPSYAAGDVLEVIARAADDAERVDVKLTLETIFAGQDETTRRLVEEHYVEGRTLKETAVRSGYSVSGVRRRLRKLREEAQKVGVA